MLVPCRGSWVLRLAWGPVAGPTKEIKSSTLVTKVWLEVP